MSGTWIWFKKEWQEAWRTKRILILLIVFLCFGIMSPLLAKLTPEIIKMSFADFAGKIPKPTSLDSWGQFYKNMSQIGIYLAVILFSGSVSREVQKGTFLNFVTKGLSRRAIILGKWFSISLQWLGVTVGAFLVTLLYTLIYFDDGKSQAVLSSLVCLLLFGILLLTVTLFASTMLSNTGGLFLTIGVMVLLYVLNLFEGLKDWNPVSLISIQPALLDGSAQVTSYTPALAVTLLGIILALTATLGVFDKKAL